MDVDFSRSVRQAILIALQAFLMFCALSIPCRAEQTVIPGPIGSEAFGGTVTVLPNGNIVVVDSDWNAARGAVYLYDANGGLISTLTGTNPFDRAGSDGILVLDTGDFVVVTPNWRNHLSDADQAGAVTWVDGNAGLSAGISEANSLAGEYPHHAVGSGGVVVLRNGGYAIASPNWYNSTGDLAGAVTIVRNSAQRIGLVRASNSLVGTRPNTSFSFSHVFELANGNVVVSSPGWSNGSQSWAGAVTWIDKTVGLIGPVTAGNSLVGTSASDMVGGYIIPLDDGDFVVGSPYWNNGSVAEAGAVTRVDGTTGRVGAVSTTNSLVGTTAFDGVGSRVLPLPNGRYVVVSPGWSNGAAAHVGAVTWVDAGVGLVGPVTPQNSLVGSNPDDSVGSGTVVVLQNGNYVISSPFWDNGSITNVGAVTWANGSTGLIGTPSPANSLIGTATEDEIGSSVTALRNGNYVVGSPYWDNGAVVDVGATTWCDGSVGRTGTVSTANSLVGAVSDTAAEGTVALENGNYVVVSASWTDGSGPGLGAVTWGEGVSGTTGTISSANSLVGSQPGDTVGSNGVIALKNGNYVVGSLAWVNGSAQAAGAVTWVDGTTGLAGPVSPANSLVGSMDSEVLGSGGIFVLPNGDFLVASPNWGFDGQSAVGAITLVHGDRPTAGAIDPQLSMFGPVGWCCYQLAYGYDGLRNRVAVGHPLANAVSLLSFSLFANGFE